LVTFPFNMLRALIFIVGRIVSNGSRRSNRIYGSQAEGERLQQKIFGFGLIKP
jgi:hypothetical protein